MAILAALMLSTSAVSQGPGGAYYGPFMESEAQLLSAVWPEIREAAHYGDIDWEAHGLTRAPGNREAQRVMSANWRELRTASRFEQVDWYRLVGGPSQQSRRYEREGSYDHFERQYPGESGGYGASPFTSGETAVISQVWTQIREAGSFQDINWRALGVERVPGDRQARSIMANHWRELREAERFADINWRLTTAASPDRVYR